MNWKPITEETSKGSFVVTNNMKALNAHGKMSHVWLSGRIEKPETKDDIAMCGRHPFMARESESYRKIYGVTHMLELTPLSEDPAP